MKFDSFKETIAGAKSIIILSHVNPDGDTLGAMTALYNGINLNLKRDDLETDMVYNGIIPESYKFLPNIDKAKSPKDLAKNRVYDLAIAIDIAAMDRMGDSLPFFKNAKIKMNIDHHKTNNGFGDVNFVRGDACCAGEVLFDIYTNLKFKIDNDVATGLYTSFLTDTGAFRYENTSAVTLQKSAELINYGANPSLISRYCYETKPKNMVMLHAHCLVNAKFYEDNKIAGICITNKDMDKYNAQNDYTEGLVEELRRIKTTEISFVLKEVDENTTKVSLRSKEKDISAVAQVFGGGGHTFAAGCTIRKPIKIACDKLLEEIKKVI